jgi:beta-glucosidase
MFELDLGQLAFYDEEMRLVVEPGQVEIMVGSSSEAIRLRDQFEISGERRVLGRADVAPTRVEVR